MDKSRVYDWRLPRVDRSLRPGGSTVASRVYFVYVLNAMSTLRASHLEYVENLLPSQPSGSALQTTHGPSADDWERLRPVIRRLYIDEGHTLKDVMNIMADKYGHKAT